MPIYASSSVFRDLKLPLHSSEIIGNLHVAFKLECGGQAAGTRLSDSVLTDNKSSRRPSSDRSRSLTSSPLKKPANDLRREDPTATQLGSSEELERPTSAPSSPFKVPSSPGRKHSFTLNSRPEEDSSVCTEAIILEMRVGKEMGDVWSIKHRKLVNIT